MTARPSQPVRVLRVIARLNVGGPAIQVQDLTARLTPRGYRTVLLHGRLGGGEASMAYLSEQLGVRPVELPGLRRGLGLHDVRAVRGMLGYLRHFRPHVLHTHTAKAGAIGRLAVLIAPWWRPTVVVHTFHGHVLRGEFGPVLSRLFALAERLLACVATRLVAVSDEIAEDLVELGVARREKIEVVHLGFDLSPFALTGSEREALRQVTREHLGIGAHERVVTIIARVVKVKRVDRFLAMARHLAESADIRFLVVGDGDRRPELERSADAGALGDSLVWAGFRSDIPAMCFASDVVVLTSDNEGTPVCLIEAQAAGVPVVTNEVGGVRTVVRDGVTGLITTSEPAALASAVRSLLEEPERRHALGNAGREHVMRSFSIERLVEDVDSLYARLLHQAPSR